MADEKLVSMGQQFSGLPMKDLIGAPLVAAAQANNMMAMTQTQFLLDTCFDVKHVGEDEVYKPIMVNMTLTRPVINADGTKAESVKTDFNLPLLTLIPLNSLAVDEVDVLFEMEVKSSFVIQEKENSKGQSSLSQKIASSTVSAELSGSVAATSKLVSSAESDYKKSNSAKYEIKTHAAKIPLPIGVTTVIEAFTQSIAPIHLKKNPNIKESE